jgi:transposase-like protein
MKIPLHSKGHLMKKAKVSIFQPGVEESLVADLMSGKSLPEVMAPLIKRILEAGLEGELAHHLSKEVSEVGASNRRNGKAPKQLRSEYGPIDISPSRDRNGTFEPQLVGKRDRQVGLGLERQILGLYGLGMSYEDIRRHLKGLYGVEVSDGQLHAVTEQVQASLEQWRSRPLEPLYAICWLDAIRFKVREQGRVVVKTVYFIIGVDLEGHKDVLGFYVGDHESARFWLSVLVNLQQRGVKDILIACTDNLSGFSEAIEGVFPQCEVQLCIVHQVRNSMRFIPYKDYRDFAADLKKVYRADTEEDALLRLAEAEAKWGRKYPQSVENWRSPDSYREAEAVPDVPVRPRNPQADIHHQRGRRAQQAGAKGHQDQGGLHLGGCAEKIDILDLGAYLGKMEQADIRLEHHLLAAPDSFQRTDSAVPESMTGLFPSP